MKKYRTINSEIPNIEEYCPWQKSIFDIMSKKGYTFAMMGSYICHPLRYIFIKEKKIGENRYRQFKLTIIVSNNDDWHKNTIFKASYRLELKDYSLNERGYLNNYWGRTPWATAHSYFWKSYHDSNSLIKDIKYHYPY